MFPRRILGKLYVVVVLSFVGVLISPMFAQPTVLAAQITKRSLTLQTDTALATSAQVGGSDPGGVVDNEFNFTIPSTTGIESIQFQYCSALDSADACSTSAVPTGLVTTSATLGSATSSALSTFTLVNTTNGAPYLTASSAYTPTAVNTALTVQLVDITNPTASNTTFYVTISTWTGTSPTASGSTRVDGGNVAASTANPIVLTGTMPESLLFCTGATVSESGGVPNCASATSGNITFPMLFSPSATAYTTSQMAASTNANSGYVITITGNTLTSGSNSVTAMSTAATASPGTSQFGLNLVSNTSPAVGTAITPSSDGVNYFGFPETGYNTANSYKFISGNTVADSTNGGSTGHNTDMQIYTVSYIVDVPGNQPAGQYTTTLTYICTPSF